MEKSRLGLLLLKNEIAPGNKSQDKMIRLECENNEYEICMFPGLEGTFFIKPQPEKIVITLIKDSICKRSITSNFTVNGMQQKFTYDKKYTLQRNKFQGLYYMRKTENIQ